MAVYFASTTCTSVNAYSFIASNYLRTDYNKYSVGNYFEKNFGEKGGTLVADLNYQHYTTDYTSRYQEYTDWEGALNDSYSKYKTHLNTFFSTVEYEFPYTKIGLFSISAQETYKHSKYINTSSPFNQTVNELGGIVRWMWSKGNLRWWLSCGIDWFRTNSALMKDSHNLIIPTPRLNLNWKLPKNFQLNFIYDYSGGAPTIAQLSETDQWLDTKLVYHGNASLKPYKEHSAMLKLVWDYKYLDFSLSANFLNSPGRICDMYSSTDKYMLQTLVNLSKYRKWSTQLDMTLKPLGNYTFYFWNRLIYGNLTGSNGTYKWSSSRFQWMSALTLNLTHWNIQLYYQYPGKIGDGQVVYPRAQCWSASLFYRPVTNLSLGLEWFMPFGKGFKEKEYSVAEAPVFTNTEYIAKDFNNLISLTIYYNFSFGRNRNRVSPKIESTDNDSGILHK